MELTVTISSDSAAFEGDPRWEVARILRGIADRIESGAEEFSVFDLNGNRCGAVELEV